MNPVFLGVLGAARIAPRAVIDPAAELPQVEVTAVAARDADRASEFASAHGIARSYGSYDALLADDEIDAVYIALPNALHGRWAIAALEAGKHVMCEKPFTANADEAAAVAAAGERAGKVVMEAFHYRYHPLFARFLELADTVGPVRRLSARMVALVPRLRDVRYDPGLGGGATMDVGCYAIHQLRTVAGAEPHVLDARVRRAPSGVDRAMRAHLSFADGCGAHLHVAMLEASAPVASLSVKGDAGRVTVHFPTRPDLAWITVRTSRSTRRERRRGRSTFSHQLESFCAAVQDGGPMLTGPADAVANMRVVDALYVAAGMEPRRSAL